MPQSTDLLRRLQSDSPKDRLEVARYLAEHAIQSHEQAIREALARERVRWIASALRRAIGRLSPASQTPTYESSIDKDDAPEGFAAQVYAEALETTTSQLMHEIEPLLGSLKLAAAAEVENFQNSDTAKSIDRLDQFLEAIGRLRRAASAPKLEEFDLGDALAGAMGAIVVPEGLQIQKAGPQPCIVEGDNGLVSLAFVNGLRNAIEATCEVGGDPGVIPIAVNWGTTDEDSWVSVVDQGIGFKGNVERAFDIGTTTKAEHLGMGLAIAKQALASMSGKLLIVPNERGVRFEMRWPRKAR